MKTKVSAIIIMAVLFFLPAIALAGDMNPPGPPGPTMKTLDQIPPTWSQKLPCEVGNCPRFDLVMDGWAVLDMETGLVWAKNANLFGQINWDLALESCYTVGIGGRKGWRLPTAEELSSLVDPTRGMPSLPPGHPFDNVMQTWYWSATTTTCAGTCGDAWCVDMEFGDMTHWSMLSPNSNYVWPVRAGQ